MTLKFLKLNAHPRQVRKWQNDSVGMGCHVISRVCRFFKCGMPARYVPKTAFEFGIVGGQSLPLNSRLFRFFNVEGDKVTRTACGFGPLYMTVLSLGVEPKHSIRDVGKRSVVILKLKNWMFGASRVGMGYDRVRCFRWGCGPSVKGKGAQRLD